MTNHKRLSNSIKTSYLDQLTVLKTQFLKNPNTFSQLMDYHCQVIDRLLISHVTPQLSPKLQSSINIVALGGYGRFALYPYSDLDLLVICQKIEDKSYLSDAFLAIWQLPVKVNISYRTINEIKADSQEDLTFFTSLLDKRLLYGKKELFDQLTAFIDEKPIDFERFIAHHKTDEKKAQTNLKQNLEPNLKHDLGNLRTINRIFWLLQYLDQSDKKYLTTKQINHLTKAHQHLKKLRFGLHLIAEKNENNFYFNFQNTLYPIFKFNSIIEMMKPYYQSVLDILFYSELLFLILKENALSNKNIEKKEYLLKDPLNPENKNNFFIQNNYLYLKKIPKHPTHRDLIDALLLQAKEKGRLKLSSNIIQMAEKIKQNNHLPTKISAQIKARFIELFCYPKTLSFQLNLLHKLKLLATYVSLYEHTIGLSQFDLFHRFSVDVHSLQVVSEACQLIDQKFKLSMPEASQISLSIRPEILLLSAFFHDLGKGLGTAHDVIAKDKLIIYLNKLKSYLFLNDEDIKIISLLVKHHLLMSQTAQKKDISDPNVIETFSYHIENKAFLNYLYLLTICDIRGTNLTLLNNWRLSLLTKLYQKTHQFLQAKSNDKIKPSSLEKNKIPYDKINRLIDKYPAEKVHQFLNLWGFRYLRHFAISSIKWHLDCLLPKLNEEGIFIFTRFNPRIKQAELITYSASKERIFGKIARMSTSLSLTILDARIYSAPNGATLSQYVIDHQNKQTLFDELFLEKMVKQFRRKLTKGQPLDTITFRRRKPKRYLMTSTPKVRFQILDQKQLIIEVHTLDYPGILADLITVLDQFNLYITYAKINTLDQKVNDIFYVTSETINTNQIDKEDLHHRIIKEITIN